MKLVIVAVFGTVFALTGAIPAQARITSGVDVPTVGQPEAASGKTPATGPVLMAEAAQTTVTIDQLPVGTRIVPRHVYDNRKNTTGFYVPRGYKPVWKDDRLNPRRAEQSLRPPDISGTSVPRGYRNAWTDDRMNRHRGVRSSYGDAQSGLIWNQELPQKLEPIPTGRPVVEVPAQSPRRSWLYETR